MAYDITQANEEMYNAFYNLFPDIFDKKNPNESVFATFVRALAENEAQFLVDLHEFKDNINILTCSERFIGTWEELVGLPVRPDLSITDRRSRIYSRVAGTPATVQTTKRIIESFVGNKEFSIFEYWTLEDPASAFAYDVKIIRPSPNNYNEGSLIDALIRVQPAHCQFSKIVNVWNFNEGISTTDSATAEAVNYIIIERGLIGIYLIGPAV